MPKLRKRSTQRAGAPPLGDPFTASMSGISADVMAVGEKSLRHWEALVKPKHERQERSQEMSALDRKCANIPGQIEQEVLYVAGLFNPSKSLSLKVEGS